MPRIGSAFGTAARRAAADAERARRPRARVGGRHLARVSAGAARSIAPQATQRERLLMRLMTPIAKYWLCKRLPPLATEAMECLGGNGYVEEAPLARLYREAPLNGIWEGSGNVICLDVLRSIEREPASLEALREEIAAGRAHQARRTVDLRDAQGPGQLGTPGAPHRRGRRARAAGQPHGATRVAGGRRRFLRLAPGGRLGAARSERFRRRCACEAIVERSRLTA